MDGDWLNPKRVRALSPNSRRTYTTERLRQIIDSDEEVSSFFF